MITQPYKTNFIEKRPNLCIRKPAIFMEFCRPFFFCRLQSSHWSVYFLETFLKPPTPKAKSGANANLVQRFPLSFLLFQGNLQNRTGLKESHLSIFSALCDFFFEKFFCRQKTPFHFLFF